MENKEHSSVGGTLTAAAQERCVSKIWDKMVAGWADDKVRKVETDMVGAMLLGTVFGHSRHEIPKFPLC